MTPENQQHARQLDNSNLAMADAKAGTLIFSLCSIVVALAATVNELVATTKIDEGEYGVTIPEVVANAAK